MKRDLAACQGLEKELQEVHGLLRERDGYLQHMRNEARGY